MECIYFYHVYFSSALLFLRIANFESTYCWRNAHHSQLQSPCLCPKPIIVAKYSSLFLTSEIRHKITPSRYILTALCLDVKFTEINWKVRNYFLCAKTVEILSTHVQQCLSSFQVLLRDTKLKHLPDQRSATNLPESQRAKQIPDLDLAAAKLKFKLSITTLLPELIVLFSLCYKVFNKSMSKRRAASSS